MNYYRCNVLDQSFLALPTWKELSGSIVTFNTDYANPLRSLVTEIVAVQEGTGTPSPSNVRSISGFDEVIVGVTAKNLVMSRLTGTNINTSGVITEQANYDMVIARVIQDTEYVISTDDPYFAGGFFNTYPTVGGVSYNGQRIVSATKSFTAPITGYVIFRVSSNYLTPQIEIGSTATTYEAPNIHTITLPETIYGGNAELVGGNGTKTHGYVDLSTLSWASTSQNRWVATLSGVKEVTTGLSPIISEKYQTFSNTDLYYNNETGIATYNNQVIVRNNPTTDTPTGLAVFELQTPTPFTTTPEEIPTLSGVNNIYSNTGDVTLTAEMTMQQYISNSI